MAVSSEVASLWYILWMLHKVDLMRIQIFARIRFFSHKHFFPFCLLI